MIAERIRQTRAFLAGEGLGPFLVKAVAGTGAVRLAAMAASFAVGVLLARMLGVEGYGYYGIALSIITIASIPGELGVSRLVVREVAAAAVGKDNARIFGVLRWARRMALGLSAIMAAIAIVAAAVIASVHPSALALALLFGAPAIPLMVLARVEGGALLGLQHIVRGQIPGELVRPLLMSLCLSACLLIGVRIGAVSAMAIYSVTACAVFITARHWLRQRLPARPPTQQAIEGRRWLASSIVLGLNNGLFSLQTELLVLVLGLLAQPTDVGLFRVASATALMGAAVGNIVNLAVVPTISRLYAEGDRPRLQTLVTRAAQAQFAGTLALALPLLIAGRALIGLVFGPEYLGSTDAMKILVLGQVANAAFGPNAALLTMTRHERRVTIALGTAVIVNIVIAFLLVPEFGIIGAAIGVVAGQLCWNVLARRDAKRLLSIESSMLGKRRRS